LKLRLFEVEEFLEQARPPVAVAKKVRYHGTAPVEHYVVLTARWKEDPSVIVYYEEFVAGCALEDEVKRKLKERSEALIRRLEEANMPWLKGVFES